MMINRRLFSAGVAASMVMRPGLASTQARQMAWSFLKPGDVIDVIAPSFTPDDPQAPYAKIQAYFANTPFQVRFPEDMFKPGTPLNEASIVERRARFVHKALTSDSKAVWAVGGSGWGSNMLGLLTHYAKPRRVKPILGYSDITALHLYANTYLNWPSLHSVVLGANGDIAAGWNRNGIGSALDLLSGKTPQVAYTFEPLNETAATMTEISTRIVGGNFSLVSALNDVPGLALNNPGRFIFLETVADNPAHFARKLTRMTYSPLLENCAGVIFGDIIENFGQPNSPESQARFNQITQRFAEQLLPGKIVLKSTNLFGHGPVNMPLPLNTVATFSRHGSVITGVVSANQI